MSDMKYDLVTKLDRKVFAEELQPELPKRLFDAHVHAFDKTCFPEGFSLGEKSCYAKFGGEHPTALAKKMFKELLPGIEVSFNCFGSVNPNADRGRDIPEHDNKRVFAMAVVSPEDPAELLEERLATHHLVGVKPYPNLAAEALGKGINDVTPLDLLTPGQLEVLDRAKGIATVHIPRKERLADPVNQAEMPELCRRAPDTTFVFAHIGRAYFMRNVVGMLDKLAECPNAWLDTAMVNHPGVLKYAFDHFPNDRIVFGSDAPIAWLHGKSVEINNQYAYLMGEDYRIGTSIFDAEGAVEFTTFFYEQLRAILTCGLSRSQIQQLLWSNAERLWINR